MSRSSIDNEIMGEIGYGTDNKQYIINSYNYDTIVTPKERMTGSPEQTNQTGGQPTNQTGGQPNVHLNEQATNQLSGRSMLWAAIERDHVLRYFVVFLIIILLIILYFEYKNYKSFKKLGKMMFLSKIRIV